MPPTHVRPHALLGGMQPRTGCLSSERKQLVRLVAKELKSRCIASASLSSRSSMCSGSPPILQ